MPSRRKKAHAPLAVRKTADPETKEFRGLEIGSRTDPGADPPERTRIPTSFVTRGKAEGWLELEGEEVVHAPAGPPEDPWGGLGGTHTFVTAKAMTFRTRDVDEDVRYRVVHNPGKYDDPDEPSGKRVDFFYDLER